MTILTVDDNMAIRRLIRKTIGHLVNDLFECSNGADALTAYTQHNPDLVLMDIKMPGMDGLAATRQITHLFPKARVVILTDYDDDDLRTAAKQAGACGYALKQDLSELESFITAIH